METYVAYREASGRHSFSYVKNLIFFDHHLAKEYPLATNLTQEMVDQWCKQRPTEINNSCISRIYPIISFLRYIKKRGLVNIQIPAAPKPTPRTYIPHAFTKEELQNFFKACDTIVTRMGLGGDIRKITIPVFFRLLYSSGMRTTEARLLRTEDVNLKNGVVNIRYSKGHNQHFVVLHDTTLELMRIYNSAVSQLISNRNYFFPTSTNKGYSDPWVGYFFKKLWFQNNTAYATAYELRHHYAVENINQWIGQGLQTHIRLLSLSRSMGHSDIESTKYYYSLVPGLSDIIEITDKNTSNELIPSII
jgi:site-specific recombinase XerD